MLKSQLESLDWIVLLVEMYYGIVFKCISAVVWAYC